MARRKTKLSEKRRKYHWVHELDKGLDYSKPSTGIDEGNTPSCEEMLFRYKEMHKAKGTTFFAGTDTHPLDSTIMHIDQYYKTTGADRLMVHTLRDVLYYNPVTEVFISIVVVPWANLPCQVSTIVSATSDVVCQVTVEPIVSDLICKVIVWALHTDLVCQVTVATIDASSNLICQVTATIIPASSNLVCQVDAEPITWNLVSRVQVLAL